ncbi:MAG: phage minor capsid protein, partial [Lactobacillaceae bacterium]|nr:phage minor capsid protein [Lactobacillaceae bacterium]
MAKRKPKYKPNEGDQTMLALGDRAAAVYGQLQQDLVESMIKRITERNAVNDDLESNPYVWQLQKLQNMNMLNEDVIQAVMARSGVARDVMENIFEHEGVKVYQNTQDELIAQDFSNHLQSKSNDVLDTLKAYENQTMANLDSMINETLLTTNVVAEKYRQTLENIVGRVVIGGQTKANAISDAVMDLMNTKGWLTDKGGHKWSLEAYARTVIQSTTYRVYNELRMSAGRDLGVDTFYMSYHQAARPACSHIQGHIVTEGKSFRVPASKDPDVGVVYSLNDYGYGEPSGVRGINCRHVLTPFMIGINTMPDRSDLPSPADAEANGKFQAQQRAIERSVRDAKYKLRAAELLNDEP